MPSGSAATALRNPERHRIEKTTGETTRLSQNPNRINDLPSFAPRATLLPALASR